MELILLTLFMNWPQLPTSCRRQAAPSSPIPYIHVPAQGWLCFLLMSGRLKIL